MPRTKPQNAFGEIVDRIIDETMKGILGDSAGEIYYHMKDYGIKSDMLGEKPETFERAMVEIFKLGWNVIKKAILRSLCQQLNMPIDKFVDHNFAQCIEIARRGFLLKNTLSTAQNQLIDKVQNEKLNGNDDSILKLCLPELEISHKICKSCNKAIDPMNVDGFLAELCDECWELQNDVWSVGSVACIPNATEKNTGDPWN